MADTRVELYRVVIVGDGGVGKSCLTIQLTQNHFITDYDPTIENSYRKPLMVDNELCMLDILDTAGQEEYSAMRDQYFRTGNGFIVVYSVVDRHSYDKVEEYHDQILRVKEESAFPMILAANKSDLPERTVQPAEGEALSAKWGVPLLETSAKTRTNVDELFVGVVKEIKQYNKSKQGAIDSEHFRIAKKKRSACTIL
eukprot:m51a1_g9191 putative ras gtpase (198) ;mRNA; r:81645-82805